MTKELDGLLRQEGFDPESRRLTMKDQDGTELVGLCGDTPKGPAMPTWKDLAKKSRCLDLR